MSQSVYASGMRVLYDNQPAEVSLLPRQRIAFSFIHLDVDPVIHSLNDAVNLFGKKIYKLDSRSSSKRNIELNQLEQIEIARRRAYVDALINESPRQGPGGMKRRQRVINRVKAQIEDPIGVSPAQLARWVTAHTQHAHGLASTLPKRTRNRASSFTVEQIDYAIEKIDQYLLCEPQPPVQFAYDCYCTDLWGDFGTDAPRASYETFNKWYKQLYWEDVMTATKGRRATRAAKRKALRRLVVDRILERVEADAVNLSVGLVDTAGNYLGPVTLFAVIDCRSRAILGIQMQIGRGESAASVIDCFKHAISPKAPDSYSAEAEYDWPMYGIPERWVTDGGTAYLSHKVQAFCLNVTGQTNVVEVAAGWKKPFIESFFSRLRRQFACTLPGYVGKYTGGQISDFSMREKAVLTPEQFYSALTHWIVDEYHHTPHRGLGSDRTPYQEWTHQAATYPPMLPSDFERIQYIRGDVQQRKIVGDAGHLGITINKVRYNDPNGRLSEIHMAMKAQRMEPFVTCEYSPNDISSINVLDPFTEESFVVETYDDRVRVGMTLVEYQAQNPTRTRDKGFSHERVAQKSEVLNAARSRAISNAGARQSRKSTAANTAALHEEIELHHTKAKKVWENAKASNTPIEPEADSDGDFMDFGVYEYE